MSDYGFAVERSDGVIFASMSQAALESMKIKNPNSQQTIAYRIGIACREPKRTVCGFHWKRRDDLDPLVREQKRQTIAKRNAAVAQAKRAARIARIRGNLNNLTIPSASMLLAASDDDLLLIARAFSGAAP